MTFFTFSHAASICSLVADSRVRPWCLRCCSMAAKRCSNFALALAMRSSGSVLRKRARLIFAMKTSSGPGQGNKDPKIVNPKWRVNYRAISWSRFRLKEKVVGVASSTADDAGTLMETRRAGRSGSLFVTELGKLDSALFLQLHGGERFRRELQDVPFGERGLLGAPLADDFQ